MKTNLFCGLFFCFLLTTFIGCGEKLPYEVADIRGTITFEGKPVPKGMRLQFAPIGGEGRTSEAIVGDEGKFRATYTRSTPGVQVGKVRLFVSWGGGSNTMIPSEAAEIIKKFGGNTKGFSLEITKQNKNFKIELK